MLLFIVASHQSPVETALEVGERVLKGGLEAKNVFFRSEFDRRFSME